MGKKRTSPVDQVTLARFSQFDAEHACNDGLSAHAGAEDALHSAGRTPDRRGQTKYGFSPGCRQLDFGHVRLAVHRPPVPDFARTRGIGSPLAGIDDLAVKVGDDETPVNSVLRFHQLQERGDLVGVHSFDGV